jgi:hypothetical protein
MMIDFSESQIFERQMPQALHRIIGRKLSLAHQLEEFADGFGVQRGTQQPAFGFSAGVVD